MGMNEDKIAGIVRHILEEYLGEQSGSLIQAEVSGRHVHLSMVHMEALFGKGYTLSSVKELSQPGQFLAKERVTVFTSKGEFRNVAVLGPERSCTQVELSRTDARHLGFAPPVNLSGDFTGASDIYIMSEAGVVKAERSAIVAASHIHLTKKDAMRFNLDDNAVVRVKMETSRPIVLEQVYVRVNDAARSMIHIDADEANACDFQEGTMARLLGPLGGACPPLREKKMIVSVEERLITAEKANALIKRANDSIVIQKGTIVTPLARDVFNHAKVNIEYR